MKTLLDRIFCTLFCLLFACSAGAGVDGSISGTVLDTQAVAVDQARVQLFDEKGRQIQETQTSLTGEYQFFPIEMGDYQILISGGPLARGFETFQARVHVTAGANTLADAQVDVKASGLAPVQGSTPKELVVEVKAKRNLVANSSSVSQTEISQSEIRHLPQGSEVSLPKLLTSTSPGVVAGPFGQMFFRGNHANIQYQIDGVQMPESQSSTFGQSFSPRNIETMEVITGGLPAEYGQRLSAVVNIVTRSGPEKPGGELELNYGSYNTISPHLIYGGSNEAGNFHYYFSLNYNQTDRGLDTPQPVSTALSDQLQGGTDSIHNFANGNGEFAKFEWQIDNRNKLSWIFFNSQTNYQIPNYPSSFSASSSFFQPGYEDAFGNQGEDGLPIYTYVPSNTNDTQSETNAYAQVVWKHAFSDKSFLQVSPYYQYSLIAATGDLLNDLYTAPSGQYPIVNAENESNATSFNMNRHVNTLGLKADYSIRPLPNHRVKTGFQVQASDAEGYFNVQTDVGATRFGQSDPNTGYSEGIYLQDDYNLFKPLTLNVGLRFDAVQYHFSGINTADSLLQPRIGLNYLITETTQLHLFYGKLFQPAPIENLRATFAAIKPDLSENPSPLQPYDIKPEIDDYYELGVAQQLFGQQLASLNVYYKTALNMLDHAQLLNTSIAQPFNYATGYAYGVELSFRGKLAEDWSHYFNYSYGISEGRGISGGIWAGEEPDANSSQALDHSQDHTANLGLIYSKNYFWCSGQESFGSGFRTGPTKQASLPTHFTTDATVGYEFHGDSWLSQFRLSADVLNLFDNRYPIMIANGFNSSHYAPGRQFFLRFTKLL